MLLSQFTLLLSFASLLHVKSADSDIAAQNCQPFHDIYTNGTDLCETMWGSAFYVVDDESKGYTMGWFDGANPNDATTVSLGKSIPTDGGHQKCGLQYYHYNRTVEQKPGDYSMCHNYKDNACCKSSTITSWDTINANYGDEYHADRCGPLSDSCKAFFVMETCLYECDANAGLYRRYTDAQVKRDLAKYGTQPGTGPGYPAAAIPNNPDFDTNISNAWEMYKMPIKKSFCDNWYLACYNDFFCGAASGSFFECARIYQANLTPDQVALQQEQAINQDLIAITVCLSLFGCCLFSFLAYLIYRERHGKAVFSPLLAEEPDSAYRHNASFDPVTSKA